MTQEYIKVLRKVIKVGNAYYSNLPLKFVKKHGLKKGDVLLIHGNNDLTITTVEPK